MAEFSIRKTEAAQDVESFLALFGPNGESDIHPRAVIAENEWDLWLAESEGELAGGVVARVFLDDEGQRRGGEDNLIVDQRFRRQGLATRLMEVVEGYYRDQGLVGMIAGGNEADRRAVSFFESLGYRIVKRYHRPERVTAFGRQPAAERIRMAKDF